MDVSSPGPRQFLPQEWPNGQWTAAAVLEVKVTGRRPRHIVGMTVPARAVP
jgi:hypothetical protein